MCIYIYMYACVYVCIFAYDRRCYVMSTAVVIAVRPCYLCVNGQLVERKEESLWDSLFSIANGFI